ncbi:MAG TPA: hypothetical protein VI072_05930 [Polyangiaceae bacterium]
MGHRRTPWLAAALALVFGACAPQRAKSPDCTAIINRCLESCNNEPEKIQPREQVAATGKTMSVPQSACEQRCSNRCK